ncbi:AAA family ATPase [Thiorhodospira sibirica]|uniref:AAA family ATPase n=1 Tax=Thiorhodospira sibirica TaxID=154347 RepID=UPI00022C58CE|nr:AAA family ATPase [Thiorhodospira sibirica]
METVSFHPDYCKNEREVESKLIVSYLLPALGYQINMWQQEKVTRRFRLDFLAAPQPSDEKNVARLIIEAKHPKIVLEAAYHQLKRYMLVLDISYGLLTNGYEIRIYQKRTYKVHLVFRCHASELVQRIEEMKELIGREVLLQHVNPQPVPQIQCLSNPKPTGDHNMKIVAVYHNKGGVGKTTTVVNLAAAFARQGKRVLIIDLDSQANTTFSTGMIKFGDEAKDTLRDKYVYHVLRYSDTYPIREVMEKASFDSSNRIYVVSSHIRLMEHQEELNRLDFTRMVLKEKILKDQDKYDIVLIDTPPSLDLYARIALITANHLVIPSDLKPFANEGLENVRNFIKEVDGFKNMTGAAPINILGVLPNKISTNPRFLSSTFANRIENIKKRYKFPVMDAVIYDREDLVKCMEQTIEVGDLDMSDPRSIFDYKPHSKSSEEFSMLANLISQKI